MVVVVAHRSDAAARRFVHAWRGNGAALLTAEEVAAPGWRHLQFAPARSVAMIGGHPTSELDLSAVIVRMTAVDAGELSAIVPDEREYVAGEINAMLTGWLASLPCPVLNRPTGLSLCGPGWRPEQWTATAAQLGIPTKPCVITSAGAWSPPPATNLVTVVGRTVIGAAVDDQAEYALRLAGAAGAALLRVRFDGAHVISADPWADLSETPVPEALLRLIGGGYQV